jgi:uncharacterized protein (TIGR02145 family)
VVSIFDDILAIDIQGVVDDSIYAVNVNMSYTVTGSATTLPAYSRTFTIDAADTQYGVADVVAKFSWGEQKNLVIGTSGTFNATITTGWTYGAKKLDKDDDTAGIIVARFGYPTDDSGSKGTAILKVIPGIPDRMFGKADNNGDTDTHSFLYLPVTNPITGETWLNNNLGAEYADTTNPNGNFNPAQQATASNDYKAYGSLFQWGRKADGHELFKWKNGKKGEGVAGETDTRNDDPADTLFIEQYDKPYDWRVNQNNTLWENEASTNNVCPIGYRLPTAGKKDGQKKEWEIEVDSWHTDNTHEDTTSVHALASTLKLTMPGYHNNLGYLSSEGSESGYWSASIGDSSKPHRASNLFISSSSVIKSNDSTARVFGYGVRCIKNE